MRLIDNLNNISSSHFLHFVRLSRKLICRHVKIESIQGVYDMVYNTPCIGVSY